MPDDNRNSTRTAGHQSRWRMWLMAAAIALVAATALRGCVAEAFRIPTASMERHLMAGDFVIVSKLHYGARTPERPRIPLTNMHVPGLRLPSTRLPGFSEVRRGDVVVFYHPGETGPVEKRSPYVKRMIGLPGDTVQIRNKQVYVNGQPVMATDRQVMDWSVGLNGNTVPETVLSGDAEVVDRSGLREWRIRASLSEAEAMRRLEHVARIEPAAGRPDGALFPPGTSFSPDDFGPVIIPPGGVPIAITERNWPELRATLEREGRMAQRLSNGRFEIDGSIVDSVILEQDYFFVLGDSRDASADSRRWGFVPRDHIIGKAVAVYFSWDEERRRVRRERILRTVD